jgi:2-dehydro-3-deoxygalactonokinase
MNNAFIAVDWGTTSFRAYSVESDGKVSREQTSPDGILSVPNRKFEQALEQHLKDWNTEIPVIASGMITSRQGWIELPYLDCPAGPDDLANNLHKLKLQSGRTIYFATGLHLNSKTLGHDVMRSEETQVFGSLGQGASHFITPGTHSKWIDVENDKITNFATYVTGELFAALRNHTILGKLMTSDTVDDNAFVRGVQKVQSDPSGLLHQLFSARSLGLFKSIAEESLSSYLSGMLIGSEISHALQSRSKDAGYVILASPKIGDRYAKALDVMGVNASYGDPMAIVRGLRRIGISAGII